MRNVKHELGKAIESRRKELGLSPTALAEAAGVTLQGLAPLRAGEHRAYQDRLTFGVCRALQWSADSIDRLMRGEAPVIVPPMPPDGPEQDRLVLELVAQMAARLDSVEERVDAMTDRMRALEHPTRTRQPKSPQPSRSTRTERAKPHTS